MAFLEKGLRRGWNFETGPGPWIVCWGPGFAFWGSRAELLVEEQSSISELMSGIVSPSGGPLTLGARGSNDHHVTKTHGS